MKKSGLSLEQQLELKLDENKKTESFLGPYENLIPGGFSFNVCRGNSFTIKGEKYDMDGADIEEDVVFFLDKNGKRYKMDYDTLKKKIIEDIESRADSLQPTG